MLHEVISGRSHPSRRCNTSRGPNTLTSGHLRMLLKRTTWVTRKHPENLLSDQNSPEEQNGPTPSLLWPSDGSLLCCGPSAELGGTPAALLWKRSGNIRREAQLRTPAFFPVATKVHDLCQRSADPSGLNLRTSRSVWQSGE